ncbi:hypothetical protein [Micromonospora sp. MH99]|uniref:hypothetical protein n=1 Tax=Micromonospora sp. MH99 TaxID=1945510 RepID=UPI001F2C3011|nr:hypothetical protein [Micromonospora sp. MH99]MCF0095158.1 50S ribosomal protein L21 [Micromonospora sp. MH99]
MEWSIGHSLIVVLALLLGLAAGWLLRGRQDTRASGRGQSIVDGDPVAGLAVIDAPVPPAATDESTPAAAVDAPPAAVSEEPVPVDTVSAPAAVTTRDDSAPDAVDTSDMALTDAPPPAPERTGAVDEVPAFTTDPEPVAVDEQPAPATVIAPRQPMDDSTDTLPSEASHAEVTPAEVPQAETSPAETTDVETSPVETSPAATSPADTADAGTDPAEAPQTETTYTEVTPAEAAPAVAAVASSADVEDAEPVRAAPPVRTADTTATQVDTEPTGPADDFRRIQGVGPKMAAALQAAGVRTYRQLGELDEPALRDLIRAAGLRAAPALATWPQQARVLAGAGDQATAVLPGGSQG